MYKAEYFCRNVKKIMEQERLTKKEMQKIMGVCNKTLESILNGNLPQRTSTEVLLKLCKYFNKSAEYFLSENPLK